MKKVDMEYTWKCLAFWGVEEIAHLREATVRTQTANGSCNSRRLYFNNDVLQAVVDEHDPISIKSLLLPEKTKSFITKNVSRHVVEKNYRPRSPKQSQLLLGRDILVKYFTTTISKEVEKGATLVMAKRSPITPEKEKSSIRKQVFKLFGNVTQSVSDFMNIKK